MGDKEGSKFKTICTQGTPPITLNNQTFNNVSIFLVLFLLSFCICFTSVSAGSFLSVSSVVSRFATMFCLFTTQPYVNPDIEEVNVPLSSEILQRTGNCGQVAVGRFVRVFVIVTISFW